MNFYCIVFELGDKMLTLSSMENLIVPCNLKVFTLYRYVFGSHLGHVAQMLRTNVRPPYPWRLHIKFGF